VAIAEDTFIETVNKTSLQFQTGASEVATTKMILTSVGNLGLGTTTFNSAATGNLVIKEGNAPNDYTEDQIYIWAQSDSGTAEAYVQDGAGNQTKFSPHNSDGEWEYYSKNTKTGKVISM
jgi:hypothetical protein